MIDTLFSPSFGNRPSQIVGRDHTLQSILDGMKSRPGSKERATVLLGQRGSGKTVLLWEIADQARNLGYAVTSPTVVAEGMLDRIIEKTQDDGERLIGGKRARIVGGSVGALDFTAGLQFDTPIHETKSFGYKLDKLTRQLDKHGRGLLILVDELQANSPELRQLVIAYQELVGEGRNVALVMAGLPGAVSSVLNDKVLTFLNRSAKIELGPLPIGDVDSYFANAFAQIGLRISPDIRRQAARATCGSPYLLQLVGHYLVQYTPDGKDAGNEHLEEALASANEAYEDDVCKTTLAALSDRDSDFLRAMAEDDGPSRISDIAKRMGVTEDYAQKYRRRLLNSGTIVSPRRGYVAFDVPLLADFLRKR